MVKKPALLLGAHMSTAGGFDQAIIRGESIGCTTIQIFTKSNRQWAARDITSEQIDAYLKRLSHSSIGTVVAHASYLINLGSPTQETREKSAAALRIELNRCAQLNIPYLVIHPGSHSNTNEQEALLRIAQELDRILEHESSSTMILLENMAGQGSSVCYTFEQLAYIFEMSNHKKRLGICFDTCHAFAAGYDLTQETHYHKVWQQFDTILGLEHLKVIHLNDSKKPLSSRVDRHEDIGLGLMGNDAFSLLMNDPRLFHVPKILETPRDTLEDYARNMNILISLITPENRKRLGIDR